MSSTDWVGLSGIIAALVALTYQFVVLAAQRKVSADQLRVLARTLTDWQKSQQYPSESSQMVLRAASEISHGTARLADSIESIPYRLEPILAEMQSPAKVTIHQTYGNPELRAAGVDPDSAQIIRELAHSIGTPLAQIKAESLRLAKASGGQGEGLERITAAVDLCNSFLSSFREIARISSHSSALHLASLGRAIRTTADVYITRVGKPLEFSIAVPEQVEEYSNTYLLSILAPLIENAIEASPEGETVRVKFATEKDKIVFSVANKYLGEAPTPSSFAPGVTTKNCHEGMGLSTARRLVEAQRDGSIDCSVDDGTATFTITYPRRKE